jgi:hypothetical protein
MRLQATTNHDGEVELQLVLRRSEITHELLELDGVQ